MSVVRFMTGALRGEAFLPRSLISRNYVKQCTLYAETWMFIAVRARSQASLSPICGAEWDRDRFSYSSSIFLCHYHSNSVSYSTSFRSYRLCRIFAADSFVKRNTTFCLHNHMHAHLYCVLSYIEIYSEKYVGISCFGLCLFYPCFIVVYFCILGRPVMPR
jgi:hypothetical protein